jgi:hypothetical protein
MKPAREAELIPIDILQALNQVRKVVRAAGLMIEASQWRTRAGTGQSLQYAQSHTAANSVPYVTPMPATPLSAALGPAAQATIPSTPLTAHSFAANSMPYDRADSMHSLPARSLTTSITDGYMGPSGLGMVSTVLSPTGLRKETKSSGMG